MRVFSEFFEEKTPRDIESELYTDNGVASPHRGVAASIPQ